jgi:hypothetical protein
MWLEDSLTRAIEEARELAFEKNGTRTLVHEVASLAFLSRATVEREEEWTASWARQEMEKLSTRVDDASLTRWGISVVNSVGSVTEAHLTALENVVNSSLVSSVDWKSASAIRKLGLPNKQHAAMNQLREKLNVEIAAEGAVRTPVGALQAELNAELDKVRAWHEQELDAWTKLIESRQEAAAT